MSKLSETISSCSGVERCYGLLREEHDGVSINPIVFKSNRGKIRVMVVTEQPKGDRIDKDDLKQGLEAGNKNRVPQRLTHLLGTDFKDSVTKEDGIFYWTHFIKCPGKFRGYGHGLRARACADAHLSRELFELKPELLICVGSRVSKWFLGLTGKKKDWKDYIVEQVCKAKIPRLVLPSGSEVDSFELMVAFLFHPSERSGIGWYLDRKMRETLERAIESATS